MSDDKRDEVTITLSREDAENADAAIGHSLSIGVPDELLESIRRARNSIRAALEAAAGQEAGNG